MQALESIAVTYIGALYHFYPILSYPTGAQPSQLLKSLEAGSAAPARYSGEPAASGGAGSQANS